MKTTEALVLLALAMMLWSCAEELELIETELVGVVGGETTTAGEFDNVVATVIEGGLCTAAFIHPQVLLTAGHCVYSSASGRDAVSDPTKVEVRGGLDVLNSPVALPGAREVMTHPEWSGKVSFGVQDIALIHLKKPVDAATAYPIRVQGSVELGERGMVVGYGYTSYDATKSAGVQRKGESKVIDFYTRLFEVGAPASICTGDSGGPFFTDVDDDGTWEIAGVASSGQTGQCPSESGGYESDVYAARQWIIDTVLDLTGDDITPAGSGDGDADGDTDADGDGDTDGDTDTDIDSDELSTRSTSDDSCTYVPSSARGLSPLALIDVFSQ